jgi:hypothetical protein
MRRDEKARSEQNGSSQNLVRLFKLCASDVL